jgi:hypothetical protein
MSRTRKKRSLVQRWDGLLFTSSIPIRYRVKWFVEETWLKMPWIANEGEATARVVNMCFDGYPFPEDFKTKEDAVNLLQSIWNVVDNWDGSRVNVDWAAGRKDGISVSRWARESPNE